MSDITPEQLKAGRALAGWSQQELANQARVATSTVADFERGQRSPVANNLEAMRAALEKAGISFAQGGAVVGPALPARTRANVPAAGVRPIRWLTEGDVLDWADRRDAQAGLPELVRRLILAEAGYQPELRFPSGDNIQMHGWDGQCRLTQATLNLPRGWSGWEMSTNRDIRAKADSDYRARTASPGHLKPLETTYVAVTPRRWARKEQWLKQRRSEKRWAGVRAFDVVDLVQWLEQFPAAGLWFAQILGRAPTGVVELSQAWQQWSLSTKIPLSCDLVLADRDVAAARLHRWIMTDAPSALAVQAESPGEAIAFLFAAIEQFPREYRDALHTRAIVATSSDAANLLADAATPLIIVLQEAEPGFCRQLVSRGHHVYLALGSAAGAPEDVIELNRPKRFSIQHELQRMKFDEPDARRLAQDCARSLTVLKRLAPSAPSSSIPWWASKDNARTVLPALLAGAWAESEAGDRSAVERISGISYDHFVERLAPMLAASDSPVRKVGNAWRIASPRDAWMLLASSIAPSDIARFTTVVEDVLTSRDPGFAMAPDNRWFAAVDGKTAPYSELLRNGLTDTLALLSLFGSRAVAVPHATTKPIPIIRSVLEKADAAQWWTLARQLPVLAEAAPEAFMQALEESLLRNDPPVLALFEDETGLFGSSRHCHLLWALETLAWSPDYLAGATELLAKLAVLDPGGQLQNRPRRSLRASFLLWHPQTFAPLQDRLRVLDRLRKIEPMISWELLLDLYPRSSDIGHEASTPKWRDFSGFDKEPVTRQSIHKGATTIGEWLLEDVGVDPHRWANLIDRFADLSPVLRTAVADKLNTQPELFPDDTSRSLLQHGIRRLVSRHREFIETDWALPEEELANLERAYYALTPADAIRAVAWLFEEEMAPLLDPPAHDWEARTKASDIARVEAVRCIYERSGIEGVATLAHAVKFAALVGRALAASVDDLIVEPLLNRALHSGDRVDWDLAHGIIMARERQFKDAWCHSQIDRAIAENWSGEAMGKLMVSLPRTKSFVERVAAIGGEASDFYWRQVNAYFFDANAVVVAHAVERLLSVDRGPDAVRLAGHHAIILPSVVLVHALQEGAREGSVNKEDHNSSVMFQHSVEEILNKLDRAGDVPVEQIARLEWIYLQVLEYSRRPPIALQKTLATSPEFFVEVLSTIYRSEDATVQDEKLTDEQREQQKKIANQAFTLLHSWRRIPGTIESGIDSGVLAKWVNESRTLCEKAGRLSIGDQKIGEILAYCPPDPDGTWPCKAVRDVIETTRSRNLETGLSVGVTNKRGVTTRSPTDGGILERSEARSFKEWGAAVRLEWPRTSALLYKIAAQYEAEGKYHDDDADRFQW